MERNVYLEWKDLSIQNGIPIFALELKKINIMISRSDIIEAIRMQGERIKKGLGYRRDLLSSLSPLLQDYALIISGIRRCGKSTLLFQILMDKYQLEETVFLNFDTPLLYGFEFNDFRIVDEVIKENEKCRVLFFDEVQVVEGWEVYVRGKLDEGFYVVVTGSNASMLSRELGTKLTGRHITKELFPFSYAEYCGYKEQEIGEGSLYDYLYKGGFPQYLQLDNPDVLSDLVNDIVYRDIAVRYNIRDEHSLKSLLAYLVGNIGNLVSANKLKQVLGVKSTSTVSDYFSYFEQTYLISFVPRFSYSYKAQLLNPKKVYCVDNGVVSIASPSFTRDEGRRLENMVFAELRRRYSEIFYYNENQKECDFIIAENSVPCLAIQVCYSLTAENRKREVEGLLDALNFFNLPEGLLLSFNQHDKFIIGDKTVRVLPVYDYFKNIH